MVNNATELPKTIFRFIWHFLSKFKVAVSFYVFLSVIAGLWGPFNSILIKNVIDLLPQVQGGDASILLIPVGLIVLNFLVFDNGLTLKKQTPDYATFDRLHSTSYGTL